MTNPINPSSDEQWLSDISAGAGIYSGLQRGGARGEIQAGLGAEKLGANLGFFGGAKGAANTYAGELGNVLGIYSGLQQGGVAGYGGAAVNAAQLGARTGAFGAASGEIGAVAGEVAVPLAIYNFAENWQSGKTGSDAIQGAEAGAAIGSVVGPIGTAAGLVIGGVVGALSSAFGPGAKDPESSYFAAYADAYGKGGAKAVQAATPPQTFQSLAGLFDLRSGQISPNVPMYNQYGRMGENQFTADMTGKINQALAKGLILKTATPAQIYSQVVAPWMKSWNKGDLSKDPHGAAIQNMVTQLIGQWQKGQLTARTPVGIDGETIAGLQAFGAQGYSDPAAAKKTVTQNIAPIHAAVTSMPMPGMGTGSSSSTSAMLPLLLAMPGLAAGVYAMADPNNPGATDPSNTGGAAGVPGGDPNAAAPGAGSSSFLSDVGSFLSSPAGSLTEFGALAGVGLSQANSQKGTNDQLAGGLTATGAPFTAAGQGELGQIQGGPPVGGPLGASITDQTTAAANLGKVATEYSTGQLTPAQQSQIDDFVKQQRAMVDTQLAASGNTDSSARQAAYQQIDTKAAELGQSLIQGDLQIAQQALTAVQGTYSNLLNQALSSAEFGFSTQAAGVQTQIQSDTQLAQSLNQLFAGIAQGVGSAYGGGKKPGSGAAGALGSAVGRIAKGVASSASGGGAGEGVTADQSAQAASDISQAADNQAWFDQQATSTDTSLALDPGYTGDLTSYTDFGG
jgi:hypothetical protein